MREDDGLELLLEAFLSDPHKFVADSLDMILREILDAFDLLEFDSICQTFCGLFP